MIALLLLCTTLTLSQDGDVQPAELAPEPLDPKVEADFIREVAIEDQKIEARLRSVYEQVDELDEIKVEVNAGVVHLTGQAFDAASRTQARELAESLDGVLLVDDDTKEATNVKERLLPSVERFFEQIRNLVAALPLLALAVLVVSFFAWLARRLSRAEGLYRRLSDNALIQSLARQFVRIAIVTVGVFIALELLGATALVGAVLGSVGIVSLALGLAFRDIAENYLASIILSVRKPFTTKDVVEIDGERGKVIRMTTRETVLMSFDGNHVLLPNAAVFKSKVVNYTRSHRRRFTVGVGFGTDVDLRAAIELGLEKLRSVPGVLDDPAPRAWIDALGDSNVLVNFAGWVNQREADFTKVQSESIRTVKEAMDDHDFDMPAPIYQVDLVGAFPGASIQAGSPPKKVTPPRQSAEHSDVSIDKSLDEAVDQDLAAGGDEDLLGSQSAIQTT